MDINKVIVVGRLTKNPELKSLSSGTSVASFSIATNRSWNKDGQKQEEVSYFNCTAWAKVGELVCKYLQKGSRVCIDGRLQQQRWTTQAGENRSAVAIVVENIQFLSASAEKPTSVVEGGQPVNLPPEDNPFNDDSIPF